MNIKLREQREFSVKPDESNDRKALKPDFLMQVGMGFWASKIFLTAVKIGLFTLLENKPMRSEKIRETLGLHVRGTTDFLDSLVSLGILNRDEGQAYSNTPEAGFFFSRKSPAYLGDMMEMANDRLWGFWGRFDEALTTGKPQNESREGGDFFKILYSNDRSRRLFLRAMIGLSLGSSMELVQIFDFKRHKIFCDIGGGPGTLALAVARSFPDIKVINFDFDSAKDVFEENASSQGLASRVVWKGGDCLKSPLPPADLYALGHVLHGWGDSEETQFMLRKVYGALPSKGRLMIIESFIDDERRKNSFGLMMSLDMMIETPAGRNFTGKEVCDWMKKAGFEDIELIQLAGPHGLVVGTRK